jgi:hypothetical protein
MEEGPPKGDLRIALAVVSLPWLFFGATIFVVPLFHAWIR